MQLHLHHYHHHDEDVAKELRRIRTVLELMEQLLSIDNQEASNVGSTIQDIKDKVAALKTEVSGQGTVVKSSELLLVKLKTMLQQAVVDSSSRDELVASIQAITDEIHTQKSELAQSVADNTMADGEEPPVVPATTDEPAAEPTT
jgi:hypothetical protein